MMQDENQLLSDVLTRLRTVGDSLMIGFDEVQQWPNGLLDTLELSGLLAKDVQAHSLECIGCEHGCFMPVVFTDDALRAFIVCDHPEQQDHMGRIAIDLPRLSQWQLSSKQVAGVIAKLLGVKTKPVYQKEAASYTLGMFKSKKGRRAVVLAVNPLSVVVNHRSLSVDKLLYVEENKLLIDTLQFEDALNAKPISNGKDYTPDTDKREARRLKRQAMHQDWNDAYLASQIKHPTKSDSWHSEQIAKLPVAQGRSSETIRKNMKT